MNRSTRSLSQRNRLRRGIAVVELALCLPVLVLVLIGTLETCRMLHMQQNAAITAYEGCRIGIMPGSTNAAIQSQCQILLDDRNVVSYSIATTPNDISTLNVGDPLTVTVNIDCVANSLMGGMFYQTETISESVVMKAE